MNRTSVRFQPRTPKLKSGERQGKSAFYDYYAGYSAGFVMDVFHYWGLPSGSVVLDPWNGSGTTTDIATRYSYRGIGYDLNPVMAIVAKARTIEPIMVLQLDDALQLVMKQARRFRKRALVDSDPLYEWFSAETVDSIRKIERSIQIITDGHTSYTTLANNKERLHGISSVGAFFYVALFRVLKELSLPFRSSNPTWIKRPRKSADRQYFSCDEIFASFEDHVCDMIHLLGQEEPSEGSCYEPQFGVASSERVPLQRESVDAIITSPPYCTRIDYAVSTMLELSLLGYDQEALTKLRKQLIGSPLTSSVVPEANLNWGPTCCDIIDKITLHPSKASSTYYLRTYLQYFHGMFQSLQEIDRVLKNGGKSVFVVQNSFYKDVYIDLGRILIEMGRILGWEVAVTFDFAFKQNMMHINTRSKRYRGSSIETESALFFTKGEG